MAFLSISKIVGSRFFAITPLTFLVFGDLRPQFPTQHLPRWPMYFQNSLHALEVMASVAADLHTAFPVVAGLAGANEPRADRLVIHIDLGVVIALPLHAGHLSSVRCGNALNVKWFIPRRALLLVLLIEGHLVAGAEALPTGAIYPARAQMAPCARGQELPATAVAAQHQTNPFTASTIREV
jgi:hypothetical protein